MATEDYLLSLGLGKVKYEPRGKNTPPDFSLNGTIGIEATRLVQVIERNGVPINITEEVPKILQSFENAIASITNPKFSGSYFVMVDFFFPLDRRASAKLIGKYLKNLSQESIVVPHEIKLSEALKIQIFASSKVFNTPFVHGGSNQVNGGGFVLDDIIAQSRQAIIRKQKSIHHIQGEKAYPF
jgi:hypothetical protein